MRQRAMIAMALACDPAIVIGDEPTTALDVMVQAQILELLEQLRRELGLSLILITHDLSVIAETCDRVLIMYAGQVAEEGPVDEVFRRRATRTPRSSCRRSRTSAPTGGRSTSSRARRPDLRDPPPGCRFAPRCPVGDGRLHARSCRRRSLRRRPRRLPPLPGEDGAASPVVAPPSRADAIAAPAPDAGRPVGAGCGRRLAPDGELRPAPRGPRGPLPVRGGLVDRLPRRAGGSSGPSTGST